MTLLGTAGLRSAKCFLPPEIKGDSKNTAFPSRKYSVLQWEGPKPVTSEGWLVTLIHKRSTLQTAWLGLETCFRDIWFKIHLSNLP